jgi:hypothetical protein
LCALAFCSICMLAFDLADWSCCSGLESIVECCCCLLCFLYLGFRPWRDCPCIVRFAGLLY